MTVVAVSILIPTPHLIIFSHSDPISPAHICERAHDPQACSIMVFEAIAVVDGERESNAISVLKIFLMKSHPQMRMAIEFSHYIIRGTSYKGQAPLVDCLELIDLSTDQIYHTLTTITN